MTLVSEDIESGTRERILEVAERLFRQIGHQKTTVGDIAKELRMSTANVYRFFESKRAIQRAVAQSLMSEVELEAQRIFARPGPMRERFRDLLTTINRLNTERYVGDCKLHDMVEVAMQEDWDVCAAHIHRVTAIIGAFIALGVTSGDFETPDVPLAALCTCTAMIRFFHPQMIAQAANKPGPSIDQMIDFVIAGLKPSGK